MKQLNQVLDACRQSVRAFMDMVANWLQRLFKGNVTADMVTITGLVAHIPIALLIAYDYFLLAALLLFVFGLLDALDGAIARLQKKASAAGMLLDASTDRMKEIFLYIAIAAWCVQHDQAWGAVWAVAAIGGSLLVSYVKAKGETAIASSGLSHAVVNRMFQDGFLRFEVRMALLIVGLLSNQLFVIVIIIALFSWLTALHRLLIIIKRLAHDKH